MEATRAAGSADVAEDGDGVGGTVGVDVADGTDRTDGADLTDGVDPTDGAAGTLGAAPTVGSPRSGAAAAVDVRVTPPEQAAAEQARRAAPPRVVVAAVIRGEADRAGLILAARRCEPPALAGKWEFPGGKVEPGEDDLAALYRECVEELGVRIAIGDRIGPQYAIAGGVMVVRTYLAALLPGEPEPAPLDGHDELRWVDPATAAARALPWLPGDELILDALTG